MVFRKVLPINKIKIQRDSERWAQVIQKDELKFVRLYFLKYTWYVNDLHNI